MKRVLLTIFLLASFLKPVFAEHITGGEIFYTYLGNFGGLHRYEITLKLFRDCSSPGAPLDPTAPIAIFNMQTGAIVSTWNVQRTSVSQLLLGDPGQCVTNAPDVCYQVGFYTFTADLPATQNGYMIAYQRCCRINGINNLVNSSARGATYTARIPGTGLVASGPENSSAKFVGTETVLICGGYPFTYDFGAVDADGDQLRYEFCEAFTGGGQGNSPVGGPGTPTPNPPAAPPYGAVPYSFPYNGGAPLGELVSINPNTGLITGTAPPEGIYVVTVCVSEIRNGIVIATQRKDLQIKAGGCDIVRVQLDPEYISCDGFTYNFTHPSNPLITSFNWEFGDPSSGTSNFSTLQNPSHTFSGPGDYTIKLTVNQDGDCPDEATAIVKVYPGFFPEFNSTGICRTSPIQFNDATTANFGVVNEWHWDFDDATQNPADVSDLENPSWLYGSVGTKNVRLIVASSVGCRDTIIKPVSVIEKPPIVLAFRDTLICVPDAVQLSASSTTGVGTFNWTPTTNMVNSNTGTPTVNPGTTTTYYVELNEQGCVNTDSVKVNVVNFVTLTAMADTTVCLTDSLQLRLSTDALAFAWTPAATLDDATVQNPMAGPTGNTNYQVTASIGTCTATENILVRTVPYPQADAGLDTLICYNTPAFLRGSHDGSSFSWSPLSSLVNGNTLTPTAYPASSTNYVLSSFDNLGCPKPGRDTVLVTVLPRIRPFAGNDTLVVVGQPVQLNAEGGTSYNWDPVTGLNDPNIKSPIGTYGPETDSVTYAVSVFNDAGCADTAYVTVVVFKTNPYVFVPTGFTPNGDGLNDVVRPIAVGVRSINYFRIFNRWGQMVFSTTTNGHGWDGRIGGTLQGTNVYVWMVGATDYTGKEITLKGTVTLIR